MDINIVQFKGRVGGNDALLAERTNPNTGATFLSLSFSMAINERPYQGANGMVEKTLWMNVAQTYNQRKDGTFAPIAYQIRDALKSGEPVQIKGSLQSREITTQAGEKRTIMEVICSGIGDFIMLKDRERAPQAQAPQPVVQAQAPVVPVEAQAQTPVQAKAPAQAQAPVQAQAPTQAQQQAKPVGTMDNQGNPAF